MESDVEGSLKGGTAAGDGQSCGRRSLRGEAELRKVGDYFGDVGGAGAKSLVELFWRQELMKLGVAGSVNGVEEFFGLIAIAQTECNRDG